MFEDAWSKSYKRSKIFGKVVLGFWKYDRNRRSAWEYIQNSWGSIHAFTIIFTTSGIFEMIKQSLFDEWKSALSQKAEISNIYYNWRNS